MTMGGETKIPWCDHTMNPWMGCTPVGPGCDNCYAEVHCHRFHIEFGQDQLRVVTSDLYWERPYSWGLQASRNGVRAKVFCGSLCDVFDNRAPDGARERLWQLIHDTPNLDWLLLTKRAPNIWKYLPLNRRSNVWVGVTVENRKHGVPRMEHLKRIPAAVKFLSIEPLLEDLGELDLTGIDWVICGAESGHGARPMALRWARNIRFQCIDQNVPFFMKQISAPWKRKNVIEDLHLFPSGLQVRQFPTKAV